MLTPETIKKGTVLMCSYLKLKALPNGNYEVPNMFPYKHPYTGWTETPIEWMTFHRDWNWLHAVIDKINSSYAECNLLSCHCQILDNGYNEEAWYMGGEVIENVFAAISDYLEWLEQPQEPSMPVVVDESQDLPF